MEMFMKGRESRIPNDIARVRGRRLVITTELEEDMLLAESFIKQITGGDSVAARFLYNEWFEFVPQFKLWIAANHKPVIRGDDFAIWRRIHLVPFLVEIPFDRRDPKLAEKLRSEYPGIMRWAVEGCIEWQRTGLNPPAEILSATKAYQAAMDVFNEWITERCDLGPDLQTPAGKLYDDYVKWFQSEGHRPVNVKAFACRLGNKGIHRKRVKTGIVYVGIGLREELPIHA